MDNRTSLEILNDKISQIMQSYKNFKEENEALRMELITLKSDNELKSNEIERLKEENITKDIEIEEIVEKIENMIG